VSIKKEIIPNIRSRRGPTMDTDHFFLKVIIKQKLLIIYRKTALQLKKIE
jgi:hypothetical protein